jgi:hypothetical protein
MNNISSERWEDMQFIMGYLQVYEPIRAKHVMYPERLERVVSIYSSRPEIHDAERFIRLEYTLRDNARLSKI